MSRFFSLFLLSLALFAPTLRAAVVSGTIKDASGSLTPHATIEISGANLSAPLTIDADAQGHFASPDLKPGSYTVKVTAAGFQPNTVTLDLSDGNRTLAISLQIATLVQELTVEGKVSAHANSDPLYRQLREIGLGSAFQIRDFELKYDVGSFHFAQGTLTFLSPVKGAVTGAIFVGQGRFTLKPAQPIEQREMLRRAHGEQVDEEFSSVVFRYSGDLNRHFLGVAKEKAQDPADESAFSQWQEKVRRHRETPLGFSEFMLNGAEMDNADAEILSSLYNPVGEHSLFEAYIHGAKRKDLRFFVRTRGGAIPGLGSPEEVGLVNFDPEGMDDGIWYLSHLQSEYAAGIATSHQERRFVAARKFKVETVLGGNDHLTSVTTVTFEPLLAGERVVHFQLLPTLRFKPRIGRGRQRVVLPAGEPQSRRIILRYLA